MDGSIDKYHEEQGPLDKLRNQIHSYGLTIPLISGYTYFSSGLSGEYDIKKEFIRMRDLLDVARQLQCPMIRTFAGHLSSRNASPEQWGEMVSNMKKVLKMADLYEVNIGVEIHYNTFVDNVTSAKKLNDEINHPRLKFVFDGANLNAEKEDQMDALVQLFPNVGHVHLKNYDWNHENWFMSIPKSAFRGDINNSEFINELGKREYDGFISLEYFGENKEENILETLQDWNVI